MNRDCEKSGYTGSLADSVLTILAIVSVAVVLCGAILATGGASWRVRAFVAVVSVLFDLVFVYEFMVKAGKAIKDSRPERWSCPGWLLFASSVVPFLLVSGPFLAGWLRADFASAAVRGYAIARPPLGALATVAVLRLLRTARPFMKGRGQNSSKPVALAAGIALAVVFLGAVFTDSLLLPSWFSAWTTEHESTLAIVASADSRTARHLAETNANIKGAVSGNMVLKVAATSLMPTDYIVLSDGPVTIWFDANKVHAARGVAELVAALAACAAAMAYGIGIRRYQMGTAGSATSSDPAHVLKARATPACAEEIEGILGKPLR
jgi:hypothetical protein